MLNILRYHSPWGQNGAHLSPVGPKWAPYWPHEPCNQGSLPIHEIRIWLNHIDHNPLALVLRGDVSPFSLPDTRLDRASQE